MASKFLSPGVFTREQDFTIFASRVGLTRLGLVGLTQKGNSYPIINKIRYMVEYAGKTWEVDEFHGDNAGLTIAEIELDDEQKGIIARFVQQALNKPS